MFRRPSHKPTFTWHTLTLPQFLEDVRPLEKPMLYIYGSGLHDRSLGRTSVLRYPGLVFAVPGDLRFVGLKMTQLGVTVTLALVLAVSAGAQSAPSSPTVAPPESNLPARNSGGSLSIPKGTGIVGILSTNCDTRHSKVGDLVEVEVTQDVNPGGHILLKRGSHVMGQITQAYAFSKGSSNAKLEIVFNNVISKNGEQIPAYFAIYALAAKSDPTKDDLLDGRGMTATATRAGTAGGLGRPADGLLRPDTKGVIGLDSLRLVPMARDNPPTSLVRSEKEDVRLEKGTEIVLVVVGP